VSFKYEINCPSIEVSKTYGFEITAFPSIKPKYASLERCYNGADLVFFEDGTGGYHLERVSSTLEAEVCLSPNIWDEGIKTCEVTFKCTELDIKYHMRKEVVEFGKDISALTTWKHKIVWFTDDGDITIWKNCDDKWIDNL
jgi:hypothetical protein